MSILRIVRRSGTRVTGKMARIIIAVTLAFPLLATNVGQAEASCSLVWTSTRTAVSSKPDSGTYRYSSVVNYQLRYDTCRLGVYDRIYILSYTNQLYMYGSIQPTFVHKSLETVVLSDFGSLVYPGPIAYIDTTDITRTGNGYITRAKALGTSYVYDKDFAVYERYWLQNGLVTEKFAFKFLSGQLYCWAAC